MSTGSENKAAKLATLYRYVRDFSRLGPDPDLLRLYAERAGLALPSAQ